MSKSSTKKILIDDGNEEEVDDILIENIESEDEIKDESEDEDGDDEEENKKTDVKENVKIEEKTQAGTYGISAKRYVNIMNMLSRMKNDPYNYGDTIHYDTSINKNFVDSFDKKKREILNLKSNNKNRNIIGSSRKTSHIIQKLELTELISARATHIEGGSDVYVDVLNETTAKKIALSELKNRRFPLKLMRHLNENVNEIWDPNEMSIIEWIQ